MQRNYELYRDLIANPSKYEHIFDMVVITAINSAQKACYEHQLAIKLERNRLPKSIPFRVISDPDGHKLGSGGSTLHVLAILNSDPTVDLSRMRVLLLHAGGYSQRAPSCSVLGKLFSSIACEHPAIEDVLDLKLANYMPFALNEKMQPGVFLACSDEFESFDYDEQYSMGGRFGCEGNEIVLIAHKSALNIAKDHGVYVLETNEEIDPIRRVFSCQMVLQKPPIEKMRNLGIILKDSQTGEEYVYTDSVFYFTHSITRDLLNFHEKHFESVLNNGIEIDAYRDFLQPLGSKPLSLEEFLASQPTKSHQALTQIYKLFRGRSALIAALKDSEFFHLGTINELLDLYLNSESKFAAEFRQSLVFTRLKNSKFDIKTNCCIMNSKLSGKTSISDGSILEYCLVNETTKIDIGRNCFISNCWTKSEQNLQVPDNICLHTIAVIIADQFKYSTVFFDRRDDLKKVYVDLRELKFLGKNLPQKLIEYLESSETKMNITIWELKLFRAYNTMSESFEKSLDFVNRYLNNENFDFELSLGLYSLFDLLNNRCYERMISFRKDNRLI